MSVTARIHIREVPRGTRGQIRAVSNSEAIKNQFPKVKFGEWIYLVAFEGALEIWCDREQLDFT